MGKPTASKTDTDFSTFEELCFKELDALKASLISEESRRPRESDRIYRYNYFEDIDDNIKRTNDRLLRRKLYSLGNKLNNILKFTARTNLRTPTPMRESSVSSQGSGQRPRQNDHPEVMVDSISLIDYKNKANFTYDQNGVIHLKPKEQIKFSENKTRLRLMLNVIAKTINIIGTQSYMTQRQLYYTENDLLKTKEKPSSSQVENPSGSQQQVKATKTSSAKLDLVLTQLCSLVGCSKVHLHILNQSKGLVYGNLQCKLKSGKLIDFSANKGGTAVPLPDVPIVSIASDAKFVLVLEKDSMFQNFLDHESTYKFVEKFKAILFTAKGYPDNCSKAFLNFLWSKLHIPIMALTDADPHGCEIFLSYKFGTYQSAHENTYLAVPQTKWLGFLPKDLETFSGAIAKTIPQTKHDMRKIFSLQKRPYLKDKRQILQELEILLCSKKKAELEALNENEFLVRVYLPNKLRYALWL